MLLKAERDLIVAYGKKLAAARLVTGTSGNLSIFNKAEKLMVISPSGVDYQLMEPEDVVVMNLQQKVVDGTRKPSSEHRLHGIFYEKRKDVGAVVHTHSPFATTIACLNRDLPAVHYTIAYAGSKVACAPYATFGTDQLAENAYLAMENRNATLLANHGLVAVGADITAAFNTALEIEYVAELYYRASSIGEPVIVNDSEMNNVIERFKNYGQNSKE